MINVHWAAVVAASVIRGAPARVTRPARWGFAVGFAALACAILLAVTHLVDEHAPPDEMLEASAELTAMEQWSAPFDDLLVLPGDDIVSAAPPESPFPVPDVDPLGEQR